MEKAMTIQVVILLLFRPAKFRRSHMTDFNK